MLFCLLFSQLKRDMNHTNRRSNPIMDGVNENESGGESGRPVTRSFAKMQQTTSNPQTSASVMPSTSTTSMQILNNAGLNHLNIVNLLANRTCPQSPSYQKILISEKPVNLINILETAQITDRMPRSVTTVSTIFIH